MAVAASLSLLLAIYVSGVVRAWQTAGPGRVVRYRESAAFLAGWFVLAVALLSRLDEWSDTFFAAHMAQHELLMVVAAPLVAVGAPMSAFVWALPRRSRRGTAGRAWKYVTRSVGLLPAAIACLLHAVALWIWHIPALYDAALAHESVHAVQHLSFFGTGVLFWWVLANGRHGKTGYGVAVLYVFGTALQSGLLGALLTLSPRIWYPPYGVSNGWDVSPLEDQQMAGLIMWIPASVVFAGAGLAFLLAWLRESGRRVEHLRAQRASAPHVSS
jgi:cytochrome c oxidase assembly factor CtaG